MRYEFHPEALAEYQEAARYYAALQPDLDLSFISSIERAIQLILEEPTRWRVFDDDVRRCLTRIFPYGILYTTEPDFVLVVAVMHCSREPGYWKERLPENQR